MMMVPKYDIVRIYFMSINLLLSVNMFMLNALFLILSTTVKISFEAPSFNTVKGCK